MGFRVLSLASMVQGLELGVDRIDSLGLRVWSEGLRVEG